MQPEHTAILLSGASILISLLVTIVGFMLVKDRKRIDKEIDDLKGLAKSCTEKTMKEITTVETLAKEAKAKAESVEKNHLRRFEALHEHLNRVEVSITGQIGALSTTIAKEYVSKVEHHAQLRHDRDDS